MRKREKKPFRQKNIEKQLVAKRKRRNCPWQESCPSDLETKKCYRASVDTVYKSRITSTKHTLLPTTHKRPNCTSFTLSWSMNFIINDFIVASWSPRCVSCARAEAFGLHVHTHSWFGSRPTNKKKERTFFAFKTTVSSFTHNLERERNNRKKGTSGKIIRASRMVNPVQPYKGKTQSHLTDLVRQTELGFLPFKAAQG